MAYLGLLRIGLPGAVVDWPTWGCCQWIGLPGVVVDGLAYLGLLWIGLTRVVVNGLAYLGLLSMDWPTRGCCQWIGLPGAVVKYISNVEKMKSEMSAEIYSQFCVLTHCTDLNRGSVLSSGLLVITESLAVMLHRQFLLIDPVALYLEAQIRFF